MYSKKHIISVSVISMALGLALVAPALASAAAMTPGNFHMGAGHMQMRPGVTGNVTAINGNTLTVVNSRTNTTYAVDASSATVNKNGTASSVSAIAMGDMIFAQGTVSGTNVTATTIFDGMPPAGMFGKNGNGVFGKVVSVSGTTLTVTSGAMGSATPTTYTVDASSATVTKSGATSSVSAIAVGDMVMIEGTVSGSNVTATVIRDGMMGRMGMGQGQQGGQNPVMQGNGEPVVAGSVTAVSGNTITITNKSNVTYTVDATNAKISLGNTAGSISSVAVGDNVVVQGTVNGTSVTASSVMDQKPMQKPANNGTGNASRQGPNFMGGIANFFKHIFGF